VSHVEFPVELTPEARAACAACNPSLVCLNKQSRRRRWLSVRAWAVGRLIAPAGGVQPCP